MNREIKFRIRNTVNGSVDYVSLEYLLTNDQSRISAKNVKDDFQISQYLNIKDKNNVELYDGDIAKLDGGQVIVVNLTPKKAIEYGHGDCAFSIHLSIICGYGSGDYFEVIGNIYENPELLEQTK